MNKSYNIFQPKKYEYEAIKLENQDIMLLQI